MIIANRRATTLEHAVTVQALTVDERQHRQLVRDLGAHQLGHATVRFFAVQQPSDPDVHLPDAAKYTRSHASHLARPTTALFLPSHRRALIRENPAYFLPYS